MQEPGLDLHEWETRWQELQEAAEDDPEQTLVRTEIQGLGEIYECLTTDRAPP